jgi:lysophospholipase L1-like esterase
MHRGVMVALVLSGAMAVCAEDAAAPKVDRGPLQLTLPPACYAVVGTEFTLWFENVVLTKSPAAYKYQVEAGVGRTEARRWTWTPEASDVGQRKLTISITDAEGKSVGRASTEIHIAPAEAGKGRPLTILIVGDSLTNATAYPNEVARLLSQPGNPQWSMLGTNKPSNALPGVAHEGYGGWTWERFNTLYTAKPDPEKGYRQSSPFLFADDAGKPVLDVERYLKEHAGGKQPDVVFFLLGINDCFGAKPDDPAKMDATIDHVLKQADTLLAAFRKALPKADLAIGLTTPGNVRESAFEGDYKGSYPQWGWKRIQHRLVQKELEHFGERAKHRIFIVPTELELDTLDGYPENNSVHPNTVGYNQVGRSIYAWLKNHLAESPSR